MKVVYGEYLYTNCAYCGKEITKSKTLMKSATNHFCNENHRQLFQKEKPLEYIHPKEYKGHPKMYKKPDVTI